MIVFKVFTCSRTLSATDPCLICRISNQVGGFDEIYIYIYIYYITSKATLNNARE